MPLGVEGSERSRIMHGCISRATEHEVDAIVAHVGSQLEFAFTCEEPGSHWAFVVEYNGFGTRHALPWQLAARVCRCVFAALARAAAQDPTP